MAALCGSLNPQSLQYGRIIWVVSRVILFVCEHGGSPTLPDYQDSPCLVTIAGKVSPEVHRVSFGFRLLPFPREETGNQLQEAESLESQLLEAGLGFIHEKLSSKEASIDKFLETKGLQTHSY